MVLLGESSIMNKKVTKILFALLFLLIFRLATVNCSDYRGLNEYSRSDAEYNNQRQRFRNEEELQQQLITQNYRNCGRKRELSTRDDFGVTFLALLNIGFYWSCFPIWVYIILFIATGFFLHFSVQFICSLLTEFSFFPTFGLENLLVFFITFSTWFFTLKD